MAWSRWLLVLLNIADASGNTSAFTPDSLLTGKYSTKLTPKCLLQHLTTRGNLTNLSRDAVVEADLLISGHRSGLDSIPTQDMWSLIASSVEYHAPIPSKAECLQWKTCLENASAALMVKSTYDKRMAISLTEDAATRLDRSRLGDLITHSNSECKKQMTNSSGPRDCEWFMEKMDCFCEALSEGILAHLSSKIRHEIADINRTLVSGAMHGRCLFTLICEANIFCKELKDAVCIVHTS